VLLGRGREPRAGGGSGVRVARLCGVAPRRVEEDRLVGEPPVAVARAADTPHRFAAETIREREPQPRVDERGRLAGARRADEDVPGQVVEILLRAQRADPGPERRAISAEAQLLQEIQRLLETLAELLGLFGGRRGPRLRD